MTSKHGRDFTGELRIWAELAEVTLEATDDEIMAAVREEGRDPDEVAAQTRQRVEEAILRFRQESHARALDPPGVKTSGSRVWRSLRSDFCLADLGRADLGSWVTWRVFLISFGLVPAAIAGVVALVLSISGVPPAAVLFGTLASVLIAWSGTLACGSGVSVVAAGFGGIPVSAILGITYGFLLQAVGGVETAGARLKASTLLQAGLGGLPSLIRPSAISIATVAAAVGFLSLAMGWVRRRAGERPIGDRALVGIFRSIVISGLGPGLIVGISKLGELLGAPELAFGLGLTLLGGSALGWAAGLRSGNARRGLAFGLSYGSITGVLVLLGVRLEEPQWRLLLATTTNHILLQGTFFTLAYALGERWAGPRGGVIASSVEGIGGYVGFLLSKPWAAL